MTPKLNYPANKMDKQKFRKIFVEICAGCDIQDGWPCRRCFMDVISKLGVPDHLVHAMWLVQLAMRNNGAYIAELDPFRKENQKFTSRELRIKLDGFDPGE